MACRLGAIRVLSRQEVFNRTSYRSDGKWLTAITTKIRNRRADVHEFAAHANPETTYRHYDRWKIKNRRLVAGNS
ncbi:hypothetical protein ABIC50_001012 [Burkholderia sp. 567]